MPSDPCRARKLPGMCDGTSRGHGPVVSEGRRPPLIAIAANNAEIGGGEVMLLSIARALRELGLAVLVLAPRAEGGIADAAASEGFVVRQLAGPGRRRYMLSLALWRCGHRDVPLWCNGLVPSLATAGTGPRLVHLHLLPAGSRELAARIARKGARAVVVPSAFMSSRVPDAAELANWTEDLGAVDPGPRPEGPLRIGFMGRTTLDKGIGVLTDAVAKVLAERPGSVRLLVAGENRFGDAADDRALARCRARLGGSVEVLGWVSRRQFFASVDVAVFPSVFDEPFGLVAAEAMSAQVPFIVSDAGGLPEVAGAAHPWIARRGDASDLARVILEAVDTPEHIRRQAAATARRRWEQRFSPDAGTRRVAELLSGLERPVPHARQDAP